MRGGGGDATSPFSKINLQPARSVISGPGAPHTSSRCLEGRRGWQCHSCWVLGADRMVRVRGGGGEVEEEVHNLILCCG